jgi:hypothetical protein
MNSSRVMYVVYTTYIIHTYMTYIHLSTSTYIFEDIHTYIHTYVDIHTYIHTYIHTCQRNTADIESAVETVISAVETSSSVLERLGSWQTRPVVFSPR